MPDYDVEIEYRGMFSTRVYARDKQDAEERAKRDLAICEPDAQVLRANVYGDDHTDEGVYESTAGLPPDHVHPESCSGP